MNQNINALKADKEAIISLPNIKPYEKPQLMELGDLRTLTLGVSPFPSESTNLSTSEPLEGG